MTAPIQNSAGSGSLGPTSTERLSEGVVTCEQCGATLPSDAAFCPYDGGSLPGSVRPRTRPRDSLIGCIIDERYEVLQLLGEGGMGCVYRVRHRVLGRMFALKALRIELARDLVTAERFVQEAQAAAAISHPSIVKINDFGMLGTGQPYFVMELLEGKTLSCLLAERGAFAPAEVVVVAHKIALALDAAHAARVIHRDLKPDNVVLSALTPHHVELKVLDFGLAMMDGNSRLTRDGVVFGTPQYMSPEQATGEPLDARVDQYALGIVMYELLTGRVPFTADSYMGVLTKQLYADPVPPSKLVPALAECVELEGVILRCLAKDPAHRLPSMALLADTLADLARRAGIPIPLDGYRPQLASVRPPLESARSRRRSRRYRFWSYAIIGAFALLFALAMLYLHLVQAKHAACHLAPHRVALLREPNPILVDASRPTQLAGRSGGRGCSL